MCITEGMQTSKTKSKEKLMLYGILLTFYIFVCILLTIIIMIQKGKGSMGLGSLGGGTQMLFGGSGGQDIFQKITWVLGAIFVFGSFFLSLMRSAESKKFQYVGTNSVAQQPIKPTTKSTK